MSNTEWAFILIIQLLMSYALVSEQDPVISRK